MNSKITIQRGLGPIKPYTPGRPISEVQREFGIQDVIKLASNENPLGPSPKAMEAMQKALPMVHFYPDGQNTDLCAAIAKKFGVRPDQVTVGNGADGIIMETCQSYLDEGDEVIVGRHSFPSYDIYTHVSRAKLIKAPAKNYGLDLEAFLELITGRTKLIFVCNPNNPTGTILTRGEVESFLSKVPDNVLVVFDEAYIDFVDSPDFPDTVKYIREGRANVMCLCTFSKVYGMAGMRLGYALAQPEILLPLKTIKSPFSVNLLAQVAAIAALDDADFVKKTVAVNAEGRKYFYREFDRMKLNYIKSYTNFILVELGPRAAEICQRLLERGVIVRPAAMYELPTFARVSIGMQAQNERFFNTLEEIFKSL